MMFAEAERNDDTVKVSYAALPQDRFSKAAFESIASRYIPDTGEEEEEEHVRSSAIDQMFAKFDSKTARW
jgi:hypothetical protein